MSDAAVLICEHDKLVAACLISKHNTQVEAIQFVAEDARRSDRIEIVDSEAVRVTLEMCRTCAEEGDE